MSNQFMPLILAGGGGFLLSFLVGLISGVPFLDVILRALLWAGVLAGGTFGVMTLLKSQLPELFEETPQGPDEEMPKSSGAVNIVVDDDSQSVDRPFVEEVSQGDDEVESFSSPSPEESGFRPMGPQDMSASGADEVLEEAPAAEPEVASGEAALDEMPELGAFADSFRVQEPPGAKVDDFGSGGRGSRPMPIEGMDDDPAVMARAVQTALKRDT